MLASQDAIADIVEVLHDVDFYRPAHGLLYTLRETCHRSPSGDPKLIPFGETVTAAASSAIMDRLPHG